MFFNAVLAAKESRAKWRATCVWKETDQLANHLQRISTGNLPSADVDDGVDDPDSGLDNSHEDSINSQSSSLHNLFEDVHEAFQHCLGRFADIRLADAWELESQPTVSQPEGNPATTQPIFDSIEKRVVHTMPNDPRSINSSPISELSTLSGIPSIPCYVEGYCSTRIDMSAPLDCELENGSQHTCACGRNTSKRSVTCSVATQTLFTGEIMATKLYHDDAVGIFV